MDISGVNLTILLNNTWVDLQKKLEIDNEKSRY
jgi:hypothetical protein